MNCLFIPLAKLLKSGFNTGHGTVREPQSIHTAANLACIVLQSNQNEMFGGQAFPTFDYDLAPYVAKSFVNHLKECLNDYYDVSDFDSVLHHEITDKIYQKNKTILNESSKSELRQLLSAVPSKLFEKMYSRALVKTDKETFQAMEALVHNFNTMHSRCLPADEIIVAADGNTNINKLKVNDYVLSFNVNTQKYEYKKVKRVLDNGEKELLLLVLENGQRLRCTPDHKLYTSKGYVEAQYATDVLTKDGFSSIVFMKNDITEEVYDIEVEDNHNFCVKDKNSDNFAVVHNCGAQTPFSSINYGTDTSEEGRMIVKNVLLATQKGLGRSETPIFPVQIFKIKESVNLNPNSKNYDLFKLAIKTSAKRLFPNFTFCDSPYNAQYYKEGHPETEIAVMGCRTRVIGNVYDPEHQQVTGRGNFSFNTLNLPRLGILAKGDLKKFFTDLDNLIDDAIQQLKDRFDYIGNKHVYNYPFLMGQGIYLDSEKYGPNDTIREILKQSSISVGFCGLAECLVALTGKHHGESKESQELGLKIIRHIRKRMDEESKKTGLSWSCFATPAESTAGTFLRKDRKIFGVIPGVTDKDYYTNSFHVPVYYNTSISHKIDIESPYHEICNAGSISYIELDGDPNKNLDAYEAIVRYAAKKNLQYFSINTQNDQCPICGYLGVIGDTCPKCGFSEKDGVSIEHLKECGCYNDVKKYNDIIE